MVRAHEAMGAREAPHHESLQNTLERLMRQPPMKLDTAQMQSTLRALEEEGAPKAVLSKALGKLEYAERVQAAARVKQLTSDISSYFDVPALEVDVRALLAKLQLAAENPGVPEDILERGEAKLREADAEQLRIREEKRQAATNEIERHISVAPLLLDPEAIKRAMVAGESADVDEAVLQHAKEKIRAAARRNAAATRLEYLAASEPLDVDMTVLLEAIGEAMESGVVVSSVQAAQRLMRLAERAHAPVRSAAALVAELTALPPLDIDLESAGKALEDALKLDVSPAVTNEATSKLASARELQKARDLRHIGGAPRHRADRKQNRRP